MPVPEKARKKPRKGDKRYAPRNPRKISPLGGLLQWAPDEWAKIVKEAILSTDRLADAARELGVSKATLMRWLAEHPSLFVDLPKRRTGPRPRSR